MTTQNHTNADKATDISYEHKVQYMLHSAK